MGCQMYTDEDLDWAVKQQIFTQESVIHFKETLGSHTEVVSADDEPFKLVSNFNDIFVVIASFLVLFSAKNILEDYNRSVVYGAFALLSWGLAEIFVARKRMALPAIVLLLTFASGTFQFYLSFFAYHSQTSYLVASILTVISIYLHWVRFRVPITVAAGCAALTVSVFSLLMISFDMSISLATWSLSFSGIAIFVWALSWDARDIERKSYCSDVAFWLHLLSAPLIIHPVFTNLGLFNGEQALMSTLVVIGLYIAISLVSIIIDRRALMVSSLVYVLYTLSNFMQHYHFTSSSLAITGVIVGGGLLLLSLYWGKTRKSLLMVLPLKIKKYIPAGH